MSSPSSVSVAESEPADSDAQIELHDVGLRFGERVVFDGLDVTMRRGEITVLMGGSGAGKSTLLRMIGGLQRVDRGSVRVGGDELAGLSERALGQVRRRIGMLFQNGALLDSMTVFDNVALPLREHTKLGHAAIAEKVTSVLSAVGLEGVEELLPGALSGGMLRRAAFARSIIIEPEILLCDEPFSGLDPPNVSRIEELIVELNRRLGLTVVVSSHHMASSLRMGHKLVLLQDQKCVVGSPEELAASSDARIREFIGEDGVAYLARLHEMQSGAVPGTTAPAPERSV